MINFRTIIGNINTTSDPEKQSSLEAWFEGMLDVPFDEFTVEDLCRSVRQKLCISYLLPKVLVMLKEEPMAGEYYDGELISAISTLNKEDIGEQVSIFKQIRNEINLINQLDIDDGVKKDILKINQIPID